MKKLFSLAICVMALLFAGCEPNGPISSNKVETNNVYGITATTATVVGSAKIDVSEYQDVAFGVMYSDNKNELVARNGNRKEASYLNGKEFEVEIKGLKPQTVYYCCTWLFLNGKQYEYGDIKQFETLEGNRYTIGNFSVSNTNKVAFSSGNLQYQASTNTWRFAENQWDYLGGANSDISSSYSGWIDLFGWGTGDNPTKTIGKSSAYLTFVDWGINEISGESPNTWRTLSGEEWEYLLNGRLNCYRLFGTATVNNVYGLIILPDEWNEPDLSFTPGTKGWENNVYSIAQWKELEYEGAVFLPASGKRDLSYVDGVQQYGMYWSSTDYYYYDDYRKDFYGAHDLHFDLDDASMYGTERYYACSVRLVKDL